MQLNAFRVADVCDTADVMESVLLQHPELERKQDEIKQVRARA